MNKRKSTSVVEPRKEPKQERSRQTYQVILQGAMRVIRRDGLDKLSTNKVAEESGVSIGSLYQYFPSKQAIVAALIDQVFEYEHNRVKTALAQLPSSLGARQVVYQVLDLYYGNEDEDLAYRRALVGSVAIVDKTKEALQFHRSLGQLFINYITENYPDSGPLPDETTTVFMVQYLMRIIALSSVDVEIQKVKREVLLQEAAETLLNFLKVPAAQREPQS